MDFLVRFVQAHESFRRPEIEALARLVGVKVETVFYSATSPFCIVRFAAKDRPDVVKLARDFISRSVLSKGIYELWGSGSTYEELHKDVRKRTQHLWSQYEDVSFKFAIDGYLGKRSSVEQRDIIDSFNYLGFNGRISMDNPEVAFAVFEQWDEPDPRRPDLCESCNSGFSGPSRQPKAVFLGREIGPSRRSLIMKHDLKKRPYISTTSMDAELALVSATLALVRPGTIAYDPFVGTGGFLLAAAEFGALALGSDIDGRSFRGKGYGLEKGVGANFKKYGLESLFGDCIISDLTNTSLRLSSSPTTGRFLDAIISDPPYGVREGLKVLGQRNPPPDKRFINPNINANGIYMIDGEPAYLRPGYVAPKRAYSFARMLDDILDFAARTLVDEGRLAFWMPVANEAEDAEDNVVGEAVGQVTAFPIPLHAELELLHCCVQPFNKWSRRLLVYQRKAASEKGVTVAVTRSSGESTTGTKADDLNPFRRRYFQGFESR